MDAIRCGWIEYKHQPVLPASVAYVLLYFNIALAPGAIMTAFLTHHGRILTLLPSSYVPSYFLQYDSNVLSILNLHGSIFFELLCAATC